MCRLLPQLKALVYIQLQRLTVSRFIIVRLAVTVRAVGAAKTAGTTAAFFLAIIADLKRKQIEGIFLEGGWSSPHENSLKPSHDQ